MRRNKKMDEHEFENQTLLEQVESILDYIDQDPDQALIPDARVNLLRTTLEKMGLSKDRIRPENWEPRRYRLLKDIPGVRAGSFFTQSYQSDNVYFYATSMDATKAEVDQVKIFEIEAKNVEENPEWFERWDTGRVNVPILAIAVLYHYYGQDCTKDVRDRIELALKQSINLDQWDVESIMSCANNFINTSAGDKEFKKIVNDILDNVKE